MEINYLESLWDRGGEVNRGIPFFHFCLLPSIIDLSTSIDKCIEMGRAFESKFEELRNDVFLPFVSASHPTTLHDSNYYSAQILISIKYHSGGS